MSSSYSVNDEFTRAALHCSLKKSQILKNNLDFKKVSKWTLPELYTLTNLDNRYTLSAMPIILTKVLSRIGVNFVVKHVKVLQPWLKPDGISLNLEPDEIQYLVYQQNKNDNGLMSHNQPSHSIILIVVKNIICGMLNVNLHDLTTQFQDILGDSPTEKEEEQETLNDENEDDDAESHVSNKSVISIDENIENLPFLLPRKDTPKLFNDVFSKTSSHNSVSDTISNASSTLDETNEVDMDKIISLKRSISDTLIGQHNDTNNDDDDDVGEPNSKRSKIVELKTAEIIELNTEVETTEPLPLLATETDLNDTNPYINEQNIETNEPVKTLDTLDDNFGEDENDDDFGQKLQNSIETTSLDRDNDDTFDDTNSESYDDNPIIIDETGPLNRNVPNLTPITNQTPFKPTIIETKVLTTPVKIKKSAQAFLEMVGKSETFNNLHANLSSASKINFIKTEDDFIR